MKCKALYVFMKFRTFSCVFIHYYILFRYNFVLLPFLLYSKHFIQFLSPFIVNRSNSEIFSQSRYTPPNKQPLRKAPLFIQQYPHNLSVLTIIVLATASIPLRHYNSILLYHSHTRMMYTETPVLYTYIHVLVSNDDRKMAPIGAPDRLLLL